MLHHFRTREANPRQTPGVRAGPRLDSLSEQSRGLLSKLKHITKPSFQGSPSSRPNHRMLKCLDPSAPTGRNTKVHNRDQTSDPPLLRLCWNGKSNFFALTFVCMRPRSQLVRTGNPPLCPGAGCMAPTELSRTKWLRGTPQSQTDGRHHQDYKRRTDSAKSSLQLSWKHFLFNHCPRNPQTHHKLPHPQHPTGFLKSPVASNFYAPLPLRGPSSCRKAPVSGYHL